MPDPSKRRPPAARAVATHTLRAARDRPARRRDQPVRRSRRPATRCCRASATARRCARRRSSPTSTPRTRSRAATRRASPTSPPPAAARSTAAARRPAARAPRRRRRTRASASNNLSKGLAFELQSTDGALGGTISVGNGGDNTKPFTTNATGVATGLNADRVDGKERRGHREGRRHRDPGADPVRAGHRQRDRRGVARHRRDERRHEPGRRSARTAIVFNGDLAKCALSATITGTAPGQVTVTPTVAADKKTTAVDVRTFNGTGVAADRGFHLSAIC